MYQALGITALTAPQAAVVFGALLGLAFGLLAERTGFCLRRSVVAGPDRRQAAGVWLAGAAVALLGTQAAVAAGWIGFDCADCGNSHYLERSCGNRMCPSCQHGKTQQWVESRLQQQLPVHYFLITFTVPEQLHPLFLHRPKATLSALFGAASGALKSLARNPRFIGADLPGFFGVLHTWGRTLAYHPHVHFVVPGGGIDREKGLWRSSRADFYAPGQALAKVFRAIFADLLEAEGLNGAIPHSVRHRNWVVDCKAVGRNSEGIVKYLAPYVFKTAITDSRILAVGNGKVTFTYVKSGSRRKRRMTLAVTEFIRRYLMHVLPAGFMRVRHYGFMGSGCSLPHHELVGLVRIAQAFELDPVDCLPPAKQPFRCPSCGGALVARRVLGPQRNPPALFASRPPQRE